MKKKKKDMEIILASMTEEEKNSYIFSQKIKLLLHRRCMTQAELAQKIGITQTALSHYINCKRTPSYKTVTKIAETLDTPITYLLNKDCALWILSKKQQKLIDLKVSMKNIKNLKVLVNKLSVIYHNYLKD